MQKFLADKSTVTQKTIKKFYLISPYHLS